MSCQGDTERLTLHWGQSKLEKNTLEDRCNPDKSEMRAKQGGRRPQGQELVPKLCAALFSNPRKCLIPLVHAKEGGSFSM